jgi:putative transposase
MPRCAAAPVSVSDKDRRVLEALVRRHNAPRVLVTRAQIVLLAAAGVGVRATADQLSLEHTTIQH